MRDGASSKVEGSRALINAAAARATARAGTRRELVDTVHPHRTAVFTDRNFATGVLEVRGPVLVAFCASWDRTAQATTWLLRHLAAEHADRLTIGTLDVGENPRMSMTFEVVRVPTLLMFQSGRLAEDRKSVV